MGSRLRVSLGRRTIVLLADKQLVKFLAGVLVGLGLGLVLFMGYGLAKNELMNRVYQIACQYAVR